MFFLGAAAGAACLFIEVPQQESAFELSFLSFFFILICFIQPMLGYFAATSQAKA